MTNDGRLMGKFKNGRVSNVFAIVVILIVSVIALNQFRKVSEKLKPMWQSPEETSGAMFSLAPILASPRDAAVRKDFQDPVALQGNVRRLATISRFPRSRKSLDSLCCLVAGKNQSHEEAAEK